jgi:uncharacterized protein YycO
MFARLITWQTLGHVCHVEAVLPSGSIIAALAVKGVSHLLPDYDKESTSQIFVDIPMSPENLTRWVDYLKNRIGRPYDWDAIAGIALHTGWRMKGGFICSMLQTLALREAGVFPHPLSEKAHDITPRDLLLILSAHPAATVHPKEEIKP